MRVTGTPAMRRHGLSLTLDLPAFWKARPFLYQPDLQHLGRMIGNITRRRRRLASRRTPRIGRRYGLNHDRLIGGMTFHAFGTVQKLVNAYRKHHVAVTRCLHELDMAHLIPERADYFPAKQGATSYDRCSVSVDTLPSTLNRNDNVRFVHVSSTNPIHSPTSVTIPVAVIPRARRRLHAMRGPLSHQTKPSEHI
jgi:hypothetical protein